MLEEPQSSVGRTSYFSDLRAAVSDLGGFFNAHLHIDRSETFSAFLQNTGFSSLSLQKKHALIADLYSSGIMSRIGLTSRVEGVVNHLVAAGVTRADTSVDVIPGLSNLSSLETLLDIKQKWSDRIDLRIAAYSPAGFIDAQPERWAMLEEASQLADFIMSLPERDSRTRYPDHIGFEENCERMLALALSSGKEVHFHVDQGNHPAEADAERLLTVMDSLRYTPNRDAAPQIWMVHVISPSAYEDSRFEELLVRMKAHNVGVIVCPSAAISMRQLREVSAPSHNSMPRVLEFLSVGIPVRVGSDNIADITSPAGTPDPVLELFVLSHALRFFDIPVLARISAGVPLGQDEMKRISEHLEIDREERMHLINFYAET